MSHTTTTTTTTTTFSPNTVKKRKAAPDATTAPDDTAEPPKKINVEAKIKGSGMLRPNATLVNEGGGRYSVESTDPDNTYWWKGPMTVEDLVAALSGQYPLCAAPYVKLAASALFAEKKVPAMRRVSVEGVAITGLDDSDPLEGVLRFVPSSDRFELPRKVNGEIVVIGVVDTEEGEPSEACAVFGPHLLDAFFHGFVAVNDIAGLRAQIARIHDDAPK